LSILTMNRQEKHTMDCGQKATAHFQDARN
jgi:hypothetical protein